jgi:hypothetical protein
MRRFLFLILAVVLLSLQNVSGQNFWGPPVELPGSYVKDIERGSFSRRMRSIGLQTRLDRGPRPSTSMSTICMLMDRRYTQLLGGTVFICPVMVMLGRTDLTASLFIQSVRLVSG